MTITTNNSLGDLTTHKLNFMNSIFFVRVSILFVFFLMNLSSINAQQNDTTKRVAYLDHSLLRNEFKEYRNAKEKQAQEYQSLKADYQQKIKDIDKAHQEAILADSLSGGKQKKELEESTKKKKEELEADVAKSKKAVYDESLKIMKLYENKIKEAVIEVINENALIDVKPLEKGNPEQKNRDITLLILKKLN